MEVDNHSKRMGSVQTLSGIRWKRTPLKELDSGRGTSNSISFSDRNSDSNSTRNRHDSDKGIIILRTGAQQELRTR